MKTKRETAQIRDSVSLHLPGDCDEPYIFLSSVFTVACHAFFEWPLLGEKTFVGLGNYQTLLADDQFRTSLLFTMKYTLFVTPALFLMAFILALLIDGKFKGVTLFRTIYFSPVVISMTSCSLIWLWIYNDLYGILNYILQKLHIIDEAILWMGSEKTSLPAIVFMITWKMAGFSMLIILAAFQSVDTEVYESAAIDGASKARQFFHITLPIIRPQVGLALITVCNRIGTGL